MTTVKKAPVLIGSQGLQLATTGLQTASRNDEELERGETRRQHQNGWRKSPVQIRPVPPTILENWGCFWGAFADWGAVNGYWFFCVRVNSRFGYQTDFIKQNFPNRN